MFNAYPEQRTSCWKFIIPLCIAAGLCLVLYASFEAAEDDRPLSTDDPSLKRMQPFLSSQTFEIGLWTRQKSIGEEPSSAPEVTKPSEEVEQLRQQLLLERSRIATQSAEIARLRGATQQTKLDKELDVPALDRKQQEGPDEPIPDSLWREPPMLDKKVSDLVPQLEKQWDSVAPAASPAPTPALKAIEKDSTITVKAGDQEIVLQISKDTTPEPSHGSGDIDGIADTSNSTQQGVVRMNSTESNSDPGRESGDKGATQITVRSGQQSIVIQVREGSDEARSPSKAPVAEKGLEKELAQNYTAAPLVALPEVETAKAVPELPEPSAVPSQDISANAESAALRGTPERSLPVDEATTTAKGYPAYANLALRTR